MISDNLDPSKKLFGSPFTLYNITLSQTKVLLQNREWLATRSNTPHLQSALGAVETQCLCNVLFVPRNHLPARMLSRNEFSVWTVLKHCIGKDLSRITMPGKKKSLFFCEMRDCGKSKNISL